MQNIKDRSIKILVFLFLLFLIGCSSVVKNDCTCPCRMLRDDSVSKLIVVEPYNTSYAKIYLLEKDDAKWKKVGFFSGRIGRNGSVNAAEKKEGDGKTPKGIYSLPRGFGTKYVKTNLPYKVLDGTEYWVDDSSSKYYNTMQIAKNKKDITWNSAEHLVDNAVEYQYAIVIDYNNPPVKDKGSAIFFHVENNKATSGCVAVSKENMLKIMSWIDSNKTKILIK